MANITGLIAPPQMPQQPTEEAMQEYHYRFNQWMQQHINILQNQV